MLMPTFLQMSQRYVPVTAEVAEGVEKSKRNGEKKRGGGIKCVVKSLASALLSLMYKNPEEIIYARVEKGAGKSALGKV